MAQAVCDPEPAQAGRGHILACALAVAALAAAVAWSLLFMLSPVWENDIWWHLKIGEQIWDSGRVPDQAEFPYPYAERSYINVHWLYELFQYGCYRLGGWGAVIVSHAVAVVAAMLISLWPLLQRKRWLAAALLLFVVSLVLNRRALIRPEAFSFVLLSLYLLVLETYRVRGGNIVYCLPPLQALWVNCQSLFILGVGIVGVYWLDELWQQVRCRPRRWLSPLALTVMLTLAACLCHPLGWHAALYPFAAFVAMWGGVPVWKQTISEFWPLAQVIADWHWLPVVATIMLLLLPLWPLVATRGRLPVRYLLLYVAFLYLAVTAVRNLALLAIVACALLVRFADSPDWWKKWQRICGATGRGILAATHLFMLLFLLWALVSQRYYPAVDDARRFGWHGIDADRYPVKAVDYILQHSLPGNLFHDLNDGGYLIWRLFPRYQVFIDTRIDPVVMSEEHFSRYIRMCEDRDYFDKMANHYHIRTVILRPCSSLQYQTFQRVFADNPRWQPVFYDADESSLVLVSRSNGRE